MKLISPTTLKLVRTPQLIILFFVQYLPLKSSNQSPSIVLTIPSPAILHQRNREHIRADEAQVRALDFAYHKYYSFYQEYPITYNYMTQQVIAELKTKRNRVEFYKFAKLLDERVIAKEKQLFERKQEALKIYESNAIVKTNCCGIPYHRGCLRHTIDTQKKCPTCRKTMRHHRKVTTYIHPDAVKPTDICPICMELLKDTSRIKVEV